MNLGQDEPNVSSGRTSASAVSIETLSHVIDAESITLHGLIGEGEFGSVHHAIWKGDFGIKVKLFVRNFLYATHSGELHFIIDIWMML